MAGHLGQRMICALMAVSLSATGCGVHGTNPHDQRFPDERPRPTITTPPPVRGEPSMPPGRAPVVVHDCDHDGGYQVNQWIRPHPVPDRGPEAHLISVYETSGGHSYGYHPTGAADVYVHRTARPLVLVFSAYEPTQWRVHVDPGVRIDRVVLYGYHRQQVTGVPADADVVDRGGQARPGGGEPAETVAAAAAAPVVSTTHCYRAATFSLRA